MVLADVERLLIGVNITCNFSYVKAKTPCLSAIMRKQPSDMCSFFPRRHRWCFTVLCWPHAHNDKNFIFHQKSPNWLWLFFLYKASFFPLPRPLWGACSQDAGVYEERLSNTRMLTTGIVQLLSASNTEISGAHSDAHLSINGFVADWKHPNRIFRLTVMYAWIRLQLQLTQPWSHICKCPKVPVICCRILQI